MSHLSHKKLVNWPLVECSAFGVHGHAGAGGPDLVPSSLREAGACLHMPSRTREHLMAAEVEALVENGIASTHPLWDDELRAGHPAHEGRLRRTQFSLLMSLRYPSTVSSGVASPSFCNCSRSVMARRWTASFTRSRIG